MTHMQAIRKEENKNYDEEEEKATAAAAISFPALSIPPMLSVMANHYVYCTGKFSSFMMYYIWKLSNVMALRRWAKRCVEPLNE